MTVLKANVLVKDVVDVQALKEKVYDAFAKWRKVKVTICYEKNGDYISEVILDKSGGET